MSPPVALDAYRERRVKVRPIHHPPNRKSGGRLLGTKVKYWKGKGGLVDKMGKKKDVRTCPECGGKGEPTGKTWPLTSPMALMGGNLIIMGTLECQECGNKFRKKLKEIPLEDEEAKKEMAKAEEDEED